MSTALCLTPLAWLPVLAVSTGKAWPPGWTLLSLRTRGASPTRLSWWSRHCSDWHRWLHGDLVQEGVVTRQVAWNRWWRLNDLKTPRFNFWHSCMFCYLKKIIRSNEACSCYSVKNRDYSLWMSCSHTWRAIARTVAWDCTSPWKNKHRARRIWLYTTTQT